MDTLARMPKRKLTVRDFERMGEAGILGPEDRVELIEGELIRMTPIGSPHAGTVKRLIHLLSPAVGEAAIVAAQDPVVLSDLSEPQPDLMLLRPREDFYTKAHPQPDDVLLLIEVADTTGPYDRNVKRPLYARAGIPEYWIVDLAQGVIEVFRSPSGEAYREHETHRPGATLSVEALPDVALDVADIIDAP